MFPLYVTVKSISSFQFQLKFAGKIIPVFTIRYFYVAEISMLQQMFYCSHGSNFRDFRGSTFLSKSERSLLLFILPVNAQLVRVWDVLVDSSFEGRTRHKTKNTIHTHSKLYKNRICACETYNILLGLTSTSLTDLVMFKPM